MSDGFEIIDDMGVTFPDGATLLDASTFQTSWECPNDVTTNRLIMDVNGHNVQVVRYDFDPKSVSVMIDGGNISVIPVTQLDSYIHKKT